MLIINARVFGIVLAIDLIDEPAWQLTASHVSELYNINHFFWHAINSNQDVISMNKMKASKYRVEILS